MSNVSRSQRSGTGPSLVLLLLCSLVLSGVLAYQAQDAARSHRAASESALRDYASLARDELRRRLEDDVDDLTDEVQRATRDAERRRNEDSRLEEYALELHDEIGRCQCPDRLHDFFLISVNDETVEWRDATLSREMRAMIMDTVSVHARHGEAQRTAASGQRSGDGEEAARIDLPGLPGTSILYAPVRNRQDEAVRIYGVVIERTAYLREGASAIINGTPLLPPSLTRGLTAETMLSVTLRSGTGEDTILQSGGVAALNTGVTDTLRTMLGSFPLDVAVRPEMADRLVIGGLPRSRLPLLIGIFLLTLGLSTIAIVQLRRQQALVRLRGGFVASVTHELRTPLAQIRLFSDLLGSGRLGEEQRTRAVRIIGEEAQRLAYLVENVLSFSRAGERQDQITTEVADLSALTREIAEAFAPLAQARASRLELTLAPDAFAPLDTDGVRQVLLNLLDNAVKYGPPGQTVRIAVSRDATGVSLRVDDEGPGIPYAEREAIWRPYQRLDRDVDAATGGSGIGLAVVRDLVAKHGGNASVEGAPGGGARFVAWFPARSRQSLPPAAGASIEEGMPS